MQKFLVAPEHVYDSPDPDDQRQLTAYYLASEVNARLAEDNATQLRLCEEAQIAAGTIAQQGRRITDLERALRKCHAVLSGAAMSKAELIDALQSIKTCELMVRSS